MKLTWSLILIASLKNLGDRATNKKKKKKKETTEIASNTLDTAKKLAEDQVQKTTSAVSNVTSFSNNLITSATSDVNETKDDIKGKAGKIIKISFYFANNISFVKIFVELKANDLEQSIESQIVQANQNVNNSINESKDQVEEVSASKINALKTESSAQMDLANTAVNQGLKVAESAIDDQFKNIESAIDDKIKQANKSVEEKLMEANKYADVKRQEFTNVSIYD